MEFPRQLLPMKSLRDRLLLQPEGVQSQHDSDQRQPPRGLSRPPSEEG